MNTKRALALAAMLLPIGLYGGAVPLPPGAVGWWRAENNTWDSVGINDIVVQPFSYATRGPYPRFTTGTVGTAFRLGPHSRSAYVVSVPPAPELDLGPGPGLTIECWINPFALGGDAPLLEWSDGMGTVGAGLGLYGSSLQTTLTDTNLTPVSPLVLRSPPESIVISNWQHVAFTFDHFSGRATLYVNGTAVTQTNTGAFSPQTKARVYVGVRLNYIAPWLMFNGAMDELTIYKRALEPAEILSIAMAGQEGKCPPPVPDCLPPDASLVGWWRAETNAIDSAGANNGQLVRLVSYPSGAAGKSFDFEGGYVRIPASTNLDLGAGPGMTIETWVSPLLHAYQQEIQDTTREFVGWPSATVTNKVSLFFSYPSDNLPPIWSANLGDTDGRSHYIRSPVGFASEGFWQHVALTYDKASGIAALYVNGAAVTRTNVGNFTLKTTGELDLGYTPSFPPPWSGVSSGSLDELALYNRALNPDEIKAIVLSRGTGKCKVPPFITTQPASFIANERDAATFGVSANGNPILRYQWFKDGCPVPGATHNFLALTNVQLMDGGFYSVAITNTFGSVLSSNAILRVGGPTYPSWRFSEIRQQPDGQVMIRFSGAPGSSCVIEASSDLLHWQSLGIANEDGSGHFDFEDASEAEPYRFYRVVIP